MINFTLNAFIRLNSSGKMVFEKNILKYFLDISYVKIWPQPLLWPFLTLMGDYINKHESTWLCFHPSYSISCKMVFVKTILKNFLHNILNSYVTLIWPLIVAQLYHQEQLLESTLSEYVSIQVSAFLTTWFLGRSLKKISLNIFLDKNSIPFKFNPL